MIEMDMAGAEISDRLRYLTLKAAGGRCALCGTTSRTASLHVVPILAAFGVELDSMENLQVLCDRCARGRQDDECDLREPSPEFVEDCHFCKRHAESAVISHGTVWAYADRYPEENSGAWRPPRPDQNLGARRCFAGHP